MVKGSKHQLQAGAVLIVLLILVSIPHQTSSAFVFPESVCSQDPEYWPTDGWLTSTPEEQDMNSTPLDQMSDYINSWPIDSMLIVRNGYIVYERYPGANNNESTTHEVWSVTKSIISILVGIAIEAGNISGVNDSLVSYFSDRTIANLDSQKEAITLEHVLSMTSGTDWDDSSDFSTVREESDWVQYILDRPMATTPGEVWNYNSGDPHLLSAIINSTTGLSPTSYAETHLFQPLGIDNYAWPVDPQGLPDGGGIAEGIRMRSRDLAKIGFLFLNNSTWDSVQIVPADWVTNSTMVQSSGGMESGYSGNYGYLWWVRPSLDVYCVFGYRGQFIFVLPSHNIVFVTTSREMRPFEFLIKQYILPSVGVFDFATTPTTSGSTTPSESLDMLPLILGAGVSIGSIVVLAVIFSKKRR